MKSMVAGLAVLALMGGAQAGEKPLPPPDSVAVYRAPPETPAALVALYDNLARKYPKGLYNKLAGRAVTGGNNTIGYPKQWLAAAFTPAANRSVKRIQLSLKYAGGTNKIVVALYDDASGVPGAPLKVWHLDNLGNYGTCCDLVVVKSGGGIPVTAGQQYWVVVKTDDAGLDAYFAWDYNVTNQTDPSNSAVYCENTPTFTCAGGNGEWAADGGTPGTAFAVYGQ